LKLKHIILRIDAEVYFLVYVVAFARIFFPSEAKLVMRIAQADSTEEFAGITNFSKLKEVDLNETPTMQNRRLRERLDALTKTGAAIATVASFVLQSFIHAKITFRVFGAVCYHFLMRCFSFVQSN
jgi:hypothetical protein